MKKWFFIALTAALAALAAFYYFSASGNKKDPEGVKTVKARKGDMRIEVIARGSVVPGVEVVVKGKAGGEIAGFPFEEGGLIKKGQVVIRLDPKTEQAKANQVEANLLMARAKLEKTKVSKKDSEMRLARQGKLYADGIISRQELDDAEISLEKSKADISLAEAEELQAKESLIEARDRLADTEIKAPFTGTILKKFVEEGQVISSTLSSASEGTQLFSMANLENIYVNAQVDEVDIGRIKAGQEVAAAADSAPGRVFAGEVERIAPKGKVERTVTVFEVAIRITGKDRAALKPGMTANVRILTDMLKGAVLVPNEALKMKENKTGVYVMANGEPRWVPVKAGKTDGMVTEVIEGLNGGDEVVTSGIRKEKERPPKRLFF